MEAKLRVAVIGAGCSGIAAVKCCLDDGLDPVCYEMTRDLGGLWNYRETVEENVACVMRSTVINTSKEMMAYSDYPIPSHFPNFMHNSLIMDYFRQYVKHFGLDRYIRYRHQVNTVQKQDGGGWTVCVTDLDAPPDDGSDGEQTRVKDEHFDAVFVACGHHAVPNIPTIPGLDTYPGTMLHTHDYRGSPARFDGQNVLVVGVGNSGLDVATEISRITKQVGMALRLACEVTNDGFS